MEDSGVVLLDFRALLEAAPDGIAVVDEQGRILVVNEQLCALFGYDSAELVQKRIRTLVPERLRDIHAEHRRSYFEHPTKRPMGIGLPLVAVRKDGTEFPVEISLSPIDADGKSFAIAAVRDISEQNRLRDQEAWFRGILETEQERYRIGMDLHDGIMQDIYAVSLGLGMAAEDIDTDSAQAKEAVRHSVEQLHSVIRDIRSYIFELRPRQFTGDLGQALLELGREFQENSSIETEVHVAPELPQIQPQVGLAFYVITHEALSNTRKYAQASKVSISLFTEDSVLCLDVHDNGCGFDTSVEAPEGHRGLRNMLSRAGLAGALLKVQSAPGQGTAIRVEVRLN